MMEFMRAGFDVLCSDLDVVWLGDPRPWVSGSQPGSAFLALADVVVSTDVTAGTNERDETGWGIHNEMNTGMVLLRSTAGASTFCLQWIARMELEVAKVAMLASSMVQWWTNDQTFFNEVVHQARTMADAVSSLKGKTAAVRSLSTELLQQMAPGGLLPARMQRATQAVEAAHAALQAAGGAAGGAERSSLSEIRGLVFKQMACATREQCLGRDAGVVPFTITTFPYLHFASGHTYFTQSLQDRLGFAPVAVHTTFQFGDTPEFTWGKRNRLRERGLWLVDDDTYYARQGPGTDPNEAHYRGYLHLTGTLVDLPAVPRRSTEASSSIKIEGDATYSSGMQTHLADVLALPEGNPNRHLLLDSIQRRLVMNAVALGRAMRRKVVMPRMTCWCDRYWWLLDACRFPGVPASQHPLPFHCPFDHLCARHPCTRTHGTTHGT